MATDDLHIYRGLIYCNKCGVRAGSFGMKLMAKSCGPPTEYGLQSLLALRQCKKTPSLTAWPSDLVGEECKQAPKSSFRRGAISKGILLRIKRPKPVLNPTPLSSTVTSTMTAIPLKRNKPILSEYHSNLQELLELHEFGEPVIWPDGLSAEDAKQLIKQQLKEWEVMQEGSNSDASSAMELPEQGGDPSLPLIHRKGVTYTAAKPLIPFVHNKRKFVYGSSSSNQAETTVSKARQEETASMFPSSSGPRLSSFDDPDLSMSESGEG